MRDVLDLTTVLAKDRPGATTDAKVAETVNNEARRTIGRIKAMQNRQSILLHYFSLCQIHGLITEYSRRSRVRDGTASR